MRFFQKNKKKKQFLHDCCEMFPRAIFSLTLQAFFPIRCPFYMYSKIFCATFNVQELFSLIHTTLCATFATFYLRDNIFALATWYTYQEILWVIKIAIKTLKTAKGRKRTLLPVEIWRYQSYNHRGQGYYKMIQYLKKK